MSSSDEDEDFAVPQQRPTDRSDHAGPTLSVGNGNGNGKGVGGQMRDEDDEDDDDAEGEDDDGVVDVSGQILCSR
jgi:hypothetical protein